LLLLSLCAGNDFQHTVCTFLPSEISRTAKAQGAQFALEVLVVDQTLHGMLDRVDRMGIAVQRRVPQRSFSEGMSEATTGQPKAMASIGGRGDARRMREEKAGRSTIVVGQCILVVHLSGERDARSHVLRDPCATGRDSVWNAADKDEAEIRACEPTDRPPRTCQESSCACSGFLRKGYTRPVPC